MLRKMLDKKLALVALLVVALTTGTLGEAVVLYWTDTQNFRQEIVEVATGTIVTDIIDLPITTEGSSEVYTQTELSDLNKALHASTSEVDITLKCTFDNWEEISENYDVYKLEVIADTVPENSDIEVGDVVLTLSLCCFGHTDSVVLDKAGEWTFDYRITITVKLVEESELVVSAVFEFSLED